MMDRGQLSRYFLQKQEVTFAGNAGLVHSPQLQTVAGRDVLMRQRFDRKRAGDGYFRLGFVSALTVLDAEDGYSSRDRWSFRARQGP